MQNNPYAPNPYAPTVSEPLRDSGFRLFSPGQIAWSAFLGSPLAGCVLMYLNASRLGDSKPGVISLIVGGFFTLVIMVVSFFLPDNFPSSILPAAYTFGMYQVAKSTQGPAIEQHLNRGGAKASSWAASGIALLTALLIVIVMFGILFTLPESFLEE